MPPCVQTPDQLSITVTATVSAEKPSKLTSGCVTLTNAFILVAAIYTYIMSVQIEEVDDSADNFILRGSFVESRAKKTQRIHEPRGIVWVDDGCLFVFVSC